MCKSDRSHTMRPLTDCKTCGLHFHEDFRDASLADEIYDLLAKHGYATTLSGIKRAVEHTQPGHSPSHTAMVSSQVCSAVLPDSGQRGQNEAPEQLSDFAEHPAVLADCTVVSDRDAETLPAHWLLLCFDYYRTMGKAKHIPLMARVDDVTFVAKMKHAYYQAKPWIRRNFYWTRVQSISFVKVLPTKSDSLVLICLYFHSSS